MSRRGRSRRRLSPSRLSSRRLPPRGRWLALGLGLLAGLGLGSLEADAGADARWLAGELTALPLPDLDPDPPALREVGLVHQHGEGVARWLGADLGHHDFGSSHPLFQEEWAFGTLQMAALGYANLAEADPEHRALHLARMERCLDGMLSETGRAFDLRRWGRDGLAAAEHPRGHAAWLGYTGLALARHRQLAGPDTRFAAVTQTVAEGLRLRFRASPIGVPETYPGERYPVDAAAGIAALAVLAAAEGTPEPVVEEWRSVRFGALRDAETGLLHQAVDASGRSVDGPRGSGTLLAAWFLGQAGLSEGAALAAAAERELAGTVMGFGTVREYPHGQEGRGDIDSGPIVLGQGVSATGFGLGVALQQCRHDAARDRFHTAEAFGGPVVDGAARHYQNGGPIGDAILFAMLSSGLGACPEG